MENRTVQGAFGSEPDVNGPDMTENVSCLVTHKCSQDHDFVEYVRPIFLAHAVHLLCDPFGPGVEVLARIRSLEYQALLFLFSRESWASRYCQAEFRAARSAAVPIFSISRSGGELPRSLRDRIFLVCGAGAETRLSSELHALAQAVRVRGVIRALLERLRFPNTPEIARHAATQLADEPDATALTEFLDYIKRIHTRQMDEIARGSLAFALGRTGTEKARQILEDWRCPGDHPYPQECISLALEMVAGKRGRGTGGST